MDVGYTVLYIIHQHEIFICLINNDLLANWFPRYISVVMSPSTLKEATNLVADPYKFPQNCKLSSNMNIFEAWF